jgi:hypothetical protein
MDKSNLSGNPPESMDESDKHLTPETRLLAMPSICLPNSHPFSHIELKLRKFQVYRYIMALREVIVEKSFQFTHVIQQAPRKTVIYRARNVVLRIILLFKNVRSLPCRSYSLRRRPRNIKRLPSIDSSGR